jgi:hypothetical protein
LGIKLPTWAFAHLLFEIIENTPVGMRLINEYFTFWPGGKPKADSFVNIVGDNIGGILGWVTASYLDKLGIKFKWYGYEK